MQAECRLVFVPGPGDPSPGAVLPQPSLAAHLTAPVRELTSSAIFTSNPCRIRHHMRELVFFRSNLLGRMQRLCLLPPSGTSLFLKPGTLVQGLTWLTQCLYIWCNSTWSLPIECAARSSQHSDTRMQGTARNQKQSLSTWQLPCCSRATSLLFRWRHSLCIGAMTTRSICTRSRTSLLQPILIHLPNFLLVDAPA